MQDPTPEGAGGGGARPDEERRGAAAGGLASGGASWLQRLFEEVRGSSQLSMAPAEPPPLTVAAVERYLAEAPPPPAAPQYWYDVTLADGACQQRCYLAPRLNGLVQRAQLRAGARLRLRRCSYLYDEKRLRYGFLCLEELEPAGGGGGTDPPAPPRRPRHCPPPLRGEKKHYLPLWNNEDPYGDMWVVDKPQAQVDVDGKRGGGGWRGRGWRGTTGPGAAGRPREAWAAGGLEGAGKGGRVRVLVLLVQLGRAPWSEATLQLR